MRRTLGVMLLVSVSLGAKTVAAQSNSSAVAEQLFNQARELAKANQWAEACPKFEASLRYDPVLGTRLNLATCYEKIGKLASAWGLYREAIEQAKKANDEKRRDYAQKQADLLEPRLPKLAITAPANPPAGLVVKRDETQIDTAELGVAVYVDPGAHVISASAPAHETFTATVTSIEGKTDTLALPGLIAKPAEPVAVIPVAQPVDTAPTGPRSKTRVYTAIGIGGAGVVATGVGILFGVQANSKKSDLESLCGSDLRCPEESFARGKQLHKDADSKAMQSTIVTAIGGAAIVAGVVVFLTAPREQEAPVARITPTVTNDGAGLVLTGSF